MSFQHLAPALWGLAQSHDRSPEAVTRFQEACLRRLVRHAYARVPYYRRRFDEAGINPNDINTLGDLAAIPISTRADIQSQQPKDMCATPESTDELRVITTSGSTGAPLTIRRTFREEQLMLAYRIRAYIGNDFDLPWRRAMIDYYSAETLRTEGRRAFHERLGILPRLLIDWRTPKGEIVNTLARYRPEVIFGPPSTLCWIADEWTAEDRRRVPLRMVITGSETVTEQMNERIKEGFGAPVADVYGCHETVFIALRRTDDPFYTICRNAAIVEVLRDGKPAEPGESGELYVTALHLHTMPFIRYRLGDLVTVDKVVGRGETVRSLRTIDGRTTEHFQLPDGRPLHPCVFSDLIKDSGLPVRRFQIIQQRRDDFLIRLVFLNSATPDLDPFRNQVAQALGPGIAVRTEPLDTLQPPAGAKFRPYIPLERQTPGTPGALKGHRIVAQGDQPWVSGPTSGKP